MHTEANSVHRIFRAQGFAISYNPPEDTNKGGTHGGEAVAIRNSDNNRNIPNKILDTISQLGTLRYAAKVIKFHKVEVCFITVYLWCSENSSERNNIIFKQIHILKLFLNLHILCAEDFSLTFTQFSESGWAKRLNVRVINPGVATAISSACGRPIDFGFIS